MFGFLFKKNKHELGKSEELNEFYSKLKELYKVDKIPSKRKKLLKKEIEEFGYLPYPHIKALEDLTDAEVLYALEFKWAANNVFEDGSFKFTNPSVLARNGIKNSNWIKKEGHNIKLINLAGLGNGNEDSTAGKFMDWMRQLLILPTGNVDKGVFNTTMYLIPFHPREFGCAYLPTASCASPNLEDKQITEKTGKAVDDQVRLFIEFAQLAGHPVMYDVLPQTGRFSKLVLANPNIARWYDIPAIVEQLKINVDRIAETFYEKYKEEDVKIVAGIYKKNLLSGSGDLSEYYQNIYNDMDVEILKVKKFLSESMMEKSVQKNLRNKAKLIIAETLKTKKKKLTEDDITNQGEVIQSLIKNGMWPAPGGAWCSAGIPVFDKMSECGSYPTFLHFDYKGKDVSCFANLDCQTPFYFVDLETGSYNNDVIKLFVDYLKSLQEKFNFDGFRVDHIDHVVDEVSEKDGQPISYRAPRKVLGLLNRSMKETTPYFVTLAEYMLWDNYFKEYHQDMNFDLLWGNDIICQSDKTPEKISEDNSNLSVYNRALDTSSCLSILKTYNNQDGEFREIDRYPGQLGEAGALFKWFKYKFLPGGRFAERPVIYIDGDESFTKTGIESVIGSEIAMKREKNYEFFEQFDAIDRFVKNNDIILKGEAHVIRQDEDGFAVWQIFAEGLKQAILVVANFHSPFEKFCVEENGKHFVDIKEGESVYDKSIQLPCDYNVIAEYVLKDRKFVPVMLEEPLNSMEFKEIKPAEFKFYLLEK